jgi:hypothetical protein
MRSLPQQVGVTAVSGYIYHPRRSRMLTAIRRLTSWVLLLAGLGIAVLARDESASFQTCMGERSVNVRNGQEPSSTNFLVHIFDRASISFHCTGSFIDVNNSTITALATIAIAGFTLTLWRTTTKQERLTREALVTTTRAFVFLEDFDNNFVTTWRNGNPSISISLSSHDGKTVATPQART